ncbi:hypothetical protein L917_07546, partial [Phytophthora nicotianae]
MVNICFALPGIEDSALSDGLDLDATVKSWAQRKLAVEEVEEELELEKDASFCALCSLSLHSFSSLFVLSRRRCLRHDSSSALPPNTPTRRTPSWSRKPQNVTLPRGLVKWSATISL